LYFSGSGSETQKSYNKWRQYYLVNGKIDFFPTGENVCTQVNTPNGDMVVLNLPNHFAPTNAINDKTDITIEKQSALT